MRTDALQFSHRFRQRKGRRNREQQMDMVRSAARSEPHDLVIAGHHGKVPPERLGIMNHVGALFGAEHTVHKDGGVRVGHSATVMQVPQVCRDVRYVCMCGPCRDCGIRVMQRSSLAPAQPPRDLILG